MMPSKQAIPWASGGAICQGLTRRIISGKGQVVHRRKGKNPWDAQNLPKLLESDTVAGI